LDRLVDGELSSEDRRQLLKRLDLQPGGWRACALAFLEAQTWRAAAGSFVDAGSGFAAPPARYGARVKPAPNHPSLRRLTLAAAVLAAFGVGVILGNRRGDEGQPLAERPSIHREGAAAIGPMASEEDAPSPKPQPDAADQDMQIVGLVRFGDDAEAQRVVPIVAGPGLDEEWLRAQPQLLPDYARRQLERQGWQVKQGRQLVSVELQDGSQVTIPLDSVRYQFVGREVY
jgi:hypothetical protein